MTKYGYLSQVQFDIIGMSNNEEDSDSYNENNASKFNIKFLINLIIMLIYDL